MLKVSQERGEYFPICSRKFHSSRRCSLFQKLCCFINVFVKHPVNGREFLGSLVAFIEKNTPRSLEINGHIPLFPQTQPMLMVKLGSWTTKTTFDLMYNRDRCSVDAKCVRGCRDGGVCTAVKYDCICTAGFHKEGSQCVKGKQLQERTKKYWMYVVRFQLSFSALCPAKTPALLVDYLLQWLQVRLLMIFFRVKLQFSNSSGEG